jgi:chromosome transmission fidelity protein 4
LNLTGNASIITNTSGQFTINVEFHDATLRPFHFTDPLKYTFGSLGDSGIVLATESASTTPSTIYYRPFDAWAAKNDWTLQLNNDESILCK